MKIVILAGGVGGAKFVDGAVRALPAEDVSVIVNTGDDFEFFGLYIAPDLDTVCYTLAGLANNETGWGRKDESWNALKSVTTLGGPGWFSVGDKDLGTHLERTRRMQQGETLTSITQAFCKAWGIKTHVFPMSDTRVSTIVKVNDGSSLPFQSYFVEQQCRPIVSGFEFHGIEDARPAPDILEAVERCDCVIFAPSNPWVSIGPILAVKEMARAIAKKKTIAISPIVGGKAIKGPAAKMYKELGIEPSAYSIAKHYQGIIQGLVIDQIDTALAEKIQACGIIPYVTDTIMSDINVRQRLADEVMKFSQKLP
ncbi:MAG TPA: 2-phospho-L-lactate transferase [Longilinea sp.]|nr:2-phospho-L-lactate transferase [Longilinea sp.]